MSTHLLQSPQWAEFKRAYGTPSVCAGGVWYTQHPIPLTTYSYAYSGRVDPRVIDFDALKASLVESNCIALHLDVPNIIKGSVEELASVKILDDHCVKSPRDEFAKGNFIIDLTKSEDTLFDTLHSKQRYNVKYAQKKGVVTSLGNSTQEFDAFYELYRETGLRQKYYYRPKSYLQKMFEIFSRGANATILTASFDAQPLASWMLVSFEDVLYYPYGGSSEAHKNLQASCLVGWEAIRYGKLKELNMFDMWGASEDLSNEHDSYHGFTNFKAKFGGTHVVYIDSYDFVVNATAYKMFNTANSIRWKLLNVLR